MLHVGLRRRLEIGNSECKRFNRDTLLSEIVCVTFMTFGFVNFEIKVWKINKKSQFLK